MSRDDYMLMQIVDAMASINQRVNLIGVIVETSVPKRTKGTDLFCSVKIVDESRPSGIHLHFFAPRMEGLPQAENFGDILIATKIMVKVRSPEPYAMFIKNLSSFALFRGKDSSATELLPYQISPRYHQLDNHKQFIMRLMEWSIKNKINVSNHSLFREIKEAGTFNLLCKILHISNVKDNVATLFVWDGTDTPPAPLKAKLEDEKESPLPLQFEPFLSRDILCTFPTVGTVLRMFVDQGSEELGFQCLKPDRWVKLTNVKCKVRAALWIAMLMPSSKICYMPDDDDAVTGHLRSYNERVLSKWGRMPFTCLSWPSHITDLETHRHNVPFVTLMDVLTYHEVTATFKCVVRVVAIYPWRAEDFRSRRGHYRVRVTLEDPTARIQAFLYAEDGLKFFGNRQSVDMLRKKRNLLLGIASEEENVTRNPPWIQCCLKSYYMDKMDIWGSRKYQIFDTKCIG